MAVLKVPLPSPSRMKMLFPLANARSGMPSPLKSAMAMAEVGDWT